MCRAEDFESSETAVSLCGSWWSANYFVFANWLSLYGLSFPNGGSPPGTYSKAA